MKEFFKDGQGVSSVGPPAPSRVYKAYGTLRCQKVSKVLDKKPPFKFGKMEV